MNKTALIQSVANKSGIPLSAAKIVVNTFCEAIARSAKEGDNLKIRNFGSFGRVIKKERRYYNPTTCKIEITPKKETLRFYLSKRLMKKFSSISTPCQSGVNIWLHPENFLNHINYGKSQEDRSKIKQTSRSKLISTKVFRSGIKLEMGQPNLGRRVVTENTKETSALKYIGRTSYYHCEGDDTENYSYPVLLVPFFDTPILEYQKNRHATGGVSEPILFEALKCLKKIEPQIEIIQNISLPIRARNYGYKPDIALVWKERNIFLDIEIDEPYDIVSRKPIHYKGSGDKLRNDYFLDNGWSVIRVSERQVIENCEEVVEFVKLALRILSQDGKFKSVSEKLENTNRWSYDEAKELECNKYRESYLGIKEVKNSSLPEEFDPEYSGLTELIYSQEIFEKPTADIISDRYDEVRTMIRNECAMNKYIVFRIKSKIYEYVAYSHKITFVQKETMYGVEFEDVIEEKKYFLRFQEISSAYGTNSLTKYEAKQGEDWEKLMADAILNSHPVEIIYDTASRGIEQRRKVLFVTFWYDLFKSEEMTRKYSSLQLLEITSGWKYKTLATFPYVGYMCGYCMNRKTLRTFSIHRIRGGRIFNVVKNLHKIEDNDIWEILSGEKPNSRIAMSMFAEIEEPRKNSWSFIGNYAHALVIDDRLDEALIYYLKIKPETKLYDNGDKNYTWKDVCNADFKEFTTKGIKVNNFKRIQERLKEKGW